MMPHLTSRLLAAFFLSLISVLVQAQGAQARYFSYKSDGVTIEQLLRDIDNGDQLDLDGLALDGEADTQRLELERFDVFAANAEVLVHNGSKIIRKPPPKGAYYHGRVSGYPDSLAVLSVNDKGKTQGIVQLRDRLWLLNDDQPDPRQRLHLSSRALPDSQTFGKPSKPMQCGLDRLIQPANIQQSLPLARSTEAEPLFAALPAGQLYQATIAIETDVEFYKLFGNADTATQYIANLFAFATTLYERETQTRLSLGEINLWPSVTNQYPWWNFTDTLQGLNAFQNYWIVNKSSVPRTIAHFLSGQKLGGGIAYLNALCSNNIGYGLSASLLGNFSALNPQPLWDIIVVTHEIGHNFNSKHTHDYQNIGGDANPVDQCVIQIGDRLYAGSLPGLNSLSGGAAFSGNGTIMSYCHLLYGGEKNISLTFGYSPFAYGIKPYRVTDVMSSFSAQTAQSYPNCLPIITSSYSLSVSKAGSGIGTVTSNPVGINCGSTCGANFSTGTNVALTPTSASGSIFAGWSNGCDSVTGTTCNVILNANKSVTATFNIQTTTYPLTITKSGSGTITSDPPGINCGATCTTSTTSFNSGQSVTLTATPAANYYFSGWSDGSCSGNLTCTFTMNAAKTINATFLPLTADSSVLTITTSGMGVVQSSPPGINSCSGTCNATFANGTSVMLTAAPVTGYYFAGWGGACSGQGTCTLTINSNQAATANFAQIPSGNPLLTITVTGGGTVATNPSGLTCSTTCSYPFPTGTAVSLIPSANIGQTFMGWTGGGCIGRSSCLITMDSPKTVGTTFQNTYTLIMPAINLLLLGD
jgi:Metallo-peptidase family M12/Divergent InlB B-repeat domain